MVIIAYIYIFFVTLLVVTLLGNFFYNSVTKRFIHSLRYVTRTLFVVGYVLYFVDDSSFGIDIGLDGWLNIVHMLPIVFLVEILHMILFRSYKEKVRYDNSQKSNMWNVLQTVFRIVFVIALGVSFFPLILSLTLFGF